MKRGEIWWASLPEPLGSEPGGRRPVLIVSSNEYNQSAIKTVTVVVITTNIKLANMPGNVFVNRDESGLPRDAVINITQITSADKSFLTERVGILHVDIFELVLHGLQLLIPR
jgi:mRNA interferase MazF